MSLSNVKYIDIVQEKRFEKRDLVVLTILYLFLLFEVLGGMFRYIFALSGLAAFVYLPKILVFTYTLYIFLEYTYKLKLPISHLLFLIVLSSSLVFGFINIGNPPQVLFGLWILLPFIFGLVCQPSFDRAQKNIYYFVLILWLFASMGVIINLFYSWPWVGYAYQVGDVSIEGSRSWGTLGFSRLAGFSRASFSAALQILLLAFFLVLNTKRKTMSVIIWLISGIAIIITTTKTVIGIYLIISLTFLFYNLIPKWSYKFFPAALLFVGIFLPFSTQFHNYSLTSELHSPVESLIFASAGDRLENEWPETFKMIYQHGTKILGRGLGGIGAPQRYFEPSLYFPADNLSLYLYTLGGIIGILLLIIFVVSLSNIKPQKSKTFFYFSCGCIILLEGWTVNVIEDPILAIIFGMTFRYVLSYYYRNNLSKQRLEYMK